jgi:hypothetical protein
VRKLLIFGIFLLLAACGPSSGTVVRKWKEPAHTSYRTTYIQCGKVMIPITNPVHVPDQWFVEIEQDGDTTTVALSESEYNHIEIGNWYNGEE